MRLRKDVGACLAAVEALRSSYATKACLPSSLHYFYKLVSIYFVEAIKGALGAVSKIDAAAMTAVRRRQDEGLQKKSTRHDVLQHLLDISANETDENALTRDHISFEAQNAV